MFNSRIKARKKPTHDPNIREMARNALDLSLGLGVILRAPATIELTLSTQPFIYTGGYLGEQLN